MARWLLTNRQNVRRPEQDPTGIETIGFVFLVRKCNKKCGYFEKMKLWSLGKNVEIMKTAPLWAILWSLIETAPYQRCKGKHFDSFENFLKIFWKFFEILKCPSLTSVLKNFDYSVVHWLTLIIRQSAEISPNLKIINFIYNLFDM